MKLIFTRMLRFFAITTILAIPLCGNAVIVNVSTLPNSPAGVLLVANAGGHSQGDLGTPGMMHSGMRSAAGAIGQDEAAKVFPLQAALFRLRDRNMDLGRNTELQMVVELYKKLQSRGDIHQVQVMPIFNSDLYWFKESQQYAKDFAAALKAGGIRVELMYVDGYQIP